MSKRRDDATATVYAILEALVETVYEPPEAAAERLKTLAAALFAAIVRGPLRLPGLSLWGFPDGGLRVLAGQLDWNISALEICTTLRNVLEHLTQWKRDAATFIPKDAAVLQSGVPVPVTLRMSLGNEAADPHRHFLALQGSPTDVFLAVTLLLLTQGTTTRVLRCPECHRVFIRASRRQTHCSKKCYDRQYWRERYTPQQKAKVRRAQYDKSGWSLGARGSPLGRLKPSTSAKSRRRSSAKSKGD